MTARLLKSYHFAGAASPGTLCGSCHTNPARARIDIIDGPAHAIDALCDPCIEDFYPDEIRVIVERGFAAFDTLPGLESKQDVSRAGTERSERDRAPVAA